MPDVPATAAMPTMPAPRCPDCRLVASRRPLPLAEDRSGCRAEAAETGWLGWTATRLASAGRYLSCESHATRRAPRGASRPALMSACPPPSIARAPPPAVNGASTLNADHRPLDTQVPRPPRYGTRPACLCESLPSLPTHARSRGRRSLRSRSSCPALRSRARRWWMSRTAANWPSGKFDLDAIC